MNRPTVRTVLAVRIDNCFVNPGIGYIDSALVAGGEN